MHRTIAGLVALAATAFAFAAPAADAAATNCTSLSLTSQGTLRGDRSEPITMSGSGTCSTGDIQDQAPASFGFSGTIERGSCFTNPYLTAHGTLTTNLSGGQTASTEATFTVGPDPTGLGETFAKITTGDGRQGVLTASFDQPYVSGIIARCGGDEYWFTISGPLLAQ